MRGCCRARTDRRGGAAAASASAAGTAGELVELAAVLNTAAASITQHPSPDCTCLKVNIGHGLRETQGKVEK